MKLSVIIPVYNESKTIRELVRQVQAVPIDKEIVIVDDGSKDGTRDILREMDGRDGIRVFMQPKNMGKGAAVATGFQKATARSMWSPLQTCPTTHIGITVPNYRAASAR